MRFVLLTALAFAAATPAITIHVSPTALLAGQTTTLTCRVLPQERNRLLVFGVLGTERERSERQLEGASARTTWGPFDVPRVPCEAGPAYCRVIRNDGSSEQVTQPLVVGGCD